MNDRRSTVTLYAKIALILYLIRFGLTLLIELFPEPVLRLLGRGTDIAPNLAQFSPALRYLPLICSAAIFLVCWYLLTASVKSNTKESARLALTAVLVVLVISPVASLITAHFTSALIVRLTGSAAYAAYSLVRTAEGYVSVISGISYPLLTAAAAVNRWRFED